MKTRLKVIGIVVIALIVGIGLIGPGLISPPAPSDEIPSDTSAGASALPQNSVKEFTMTSFFEMKDNKPATQFSLKEIAVNKGDQVRIKVTNTAGTHDFVIDEYAIKKETPLNEEVVIEFTADKTGEFVYYCSKPNHRSLGQWGTLKVTE